MAAYQRLYLLMSFISDNMAKYLIWCRRTDKPGALWSDMSYTARDLQGALQLLEHYEQEWGSMYQYEIHRDGFYPRGTRAPAFVGIND